MKSKSLIRPVRTLSASAAFRFTLMSALLMSSLTAAVGGWTRGLPIGQVGAHEQKAPPEAFVLGVWSGDDDGHVYGLCTYFNGKSSPAAIEGIETADGDFYPEVSTQVADAEHGSQWKTLEAPPSPAGKPVTRYVQPKEVSRPLKVDLDVFRPLIGKGKFGRLVLKSGESAVFQIDDLQPPEKMTETSADFVKEKK
jgi:hypothetical protein